MAEQISLIQAFDTILRSGLGVAIISSVFTLLLAVNTLTQRLRSKEIDGRFKALGADVEEKFKILNHKVDDFFENIREANQLEREFRYDVLQRHEKLISELFDRNTANCKGVERVDKGLVDFQKHWKDLCDERHEK